MIEQLNLFGDRDDFSILVEKIVEWYEDDKAFCVRCGFPMPRNFDKWLLDHFSAYCGGNGSVMLWGDWKWYSFSPSGLKLEKDELVPRKDGQGTEHESIFFPKQKILKAFGIKDDGRDYLRGAEE